MRCKTPNSPFVFLFFQKKRKIDNFSKETNAITCTFGHNCIKLRTHNLNSVKNLPDPFTSTFSTASVKND